MTVRVILYESLRRERVAQAKAEGDRYRALSPDPNRKMRDDVDVTGWDVATDPDAYRLVEAGARAFARNYSTVDQDDVLQEALLIVARKREGFTAALQKGKGLARHWLHGKLHDRFKTVVKHLANEVPLIEEAAE